MSKSSPSEPPRAQPSEPLVRASLDSLRRRLRDRLDDVFGHRDYRPHQERCCVAVAAGEDALLVMPTGAGKSLCYQLPGLVREGPTLVVSPLIALIDDQVAKLRSLGLRASGMHSGLGRDEIMAAARAWEAGDLDYLFVAPERLARSGWRELLARRRPALVAIDEAHCISHWGHDFRPDYRRLSERLAALRPTPFLALTATATPRVQDDIVRELGLLDARLFIHGFRRDNLAIEVLRVTPSRRIDAIELLLRDPAHRPALVYCGTRAEAEKLDAAWRALAPGDSHGAAYHAGLDASERDQRQRAFLAGELDVVFATVAFGMGVDKPDVRTVVHQSLPGTLEGYYQEIGRAGRDGLPSRAVLLYSPIDLRMHEFFLERDYPELSELSRWLRKIPTTGIDRLELLQTVGEKEQGAATNCLDKLRIHGAVRFDGKRYWRAVPEASASARSRPRRQRHEPTESKQASAADWRRSYQEQRDHRAEQIDRVMRFAEGTGCRMLQLVRHFGDQEDSGEECGLCDWCRTGGALSTSRPLEEDERRLAGQLLGELTQRPLAMGRAYREVAREQIDREAWRELVEALARERLVRLRHHSFDNDAGETVTYQRLEATPRTRRALRQGDGGADLLEDALEPLLTELTVRGSLLPAARPKARRRGRKTSSRGRGASGDREQAATPLTDEQHRAVENLRAWRLEECRARKVPAYVVLSNAVIDRIAVAMPGDESELEAVSGVGPKTLELYAEAILEAIS